MKLLTFNRSMRVLKVLVLLFLLFNLTTPVFAAFDQSVHDLVDRILVIFKSLTVLFIAFAGIRALNGDGSLIQPAILGLILIFGADLIVDFFTGIFSH